MGNVCVCVCLCVRVYQLYFDPGCLDTRQVDHSTPIRLYILNHKKLNYIAHRKCYVKEFQCSR